MAYRPVARLHSRLSLLFQISLFWVDFCVWPARRFRRFALSVADLDKIHRCLCSSTHTLDEREALFFVPIDSPGKKLFRKPFLETGKLCHIFLSPSARERESWLRHDAREPINSRLVLLIIIIIIIISILMDAMLIARATRQSQIAVEITRETEREREREREREQSIEQRGSPPIIKLTSFDDVRGQEQWPPLA